MSGEAGGLNATACPVRGHISFIDLSGCGLDRQACSFSRLISFEGRSGCRLCCCLGFRPPAESLDSHRSPFGPACGCCSASLRIVARRESSQRESAPDIRGRPLGGQTSFALVAGLGAFSRRGASAPSLLARRPCLASPCATPPLGLLTGSRSESPARTRRGYGVAFCARPVMPLQGGERSRCVRASGMGAARGPGVLLYAVPRARVECGIRWRDKRFCLLFGGRPSGE